MTQRRTNSKSMLMHAHTDTKSMRKSIEKSVPNASPLRECINAERCKADDEETLKVLALI